MKRSTFLWVLNVMTALASLAALAIVWSPWAAVLVLGTNIYSLWLDNGIKLLEAGGE